MFSFPLTRRQFIINSALGLGSLSAVNLSMLDVASAQAATDPRALVVIQLLGGLDSLLAFPYTTEGSSLPTLRGTSCIAPGGLLEFQSGLGVHPGLAVLQPHFGSTQVIMNVGNAMHQAANFSHDIAQIRMVTGGFGQPHERLGWVGRIYDGGVKVQGFGGHSATFNCTTCTEPPLITTNYDRMDIARATLSFQQGEAQNAKHIDKVLRELSALNPQRPMSDVEKRYRAAQKAMFAYIDQIKPIAAMNTAKYSSSNDQYAALPTFLQSRPVYIQSMYKTFTNQLRNIAQMMKDLKAKQRGDRIIFVLAIEGFDIHDNWRTRGDDLMYILGNGLRVFRDDLKDPSMGLDNNVVTLCTTEFGRTVKGQGAGTDHGAGYATFLTGGKVRYAVHDQVYSVAQLTNMAQTTNVWPRNVSQERIIVQLIERHLQKSGALAYPEPYFSQIPQHVSLNLLTA